MRRVFACVRAIKQRSRPVDSVQVVKLMQTVERPPVVQFFLGQRVLQFTDGLVQREREDAPEPFLTLRA